MFYNESKLKLLPGSIQIYIVISLNPNNYSILASKSRDTSTK